MFMLLENSEFFILSIYYVKKETGKEGKRRKNKRKEERDGRRWGEREELHG